MTSTVPKPTSFLRSVAAAVLCLSGLGLIAALWLQDLSGMALADALLGSVYLVIAIGLMGQSRFSLVLAIVVPAAVIGGILYATPEPVQVYRLRVAVDGVAILFSVLEFVRATALL